MNCTSWRNDCETSRIKVERECCSSDSVLAVHNTKTFYCSILSSHNRAWRRNHIQMFQFKVSGVWHSNNTDLTSAWRQCFPTLQLPHLLLRRPPHPQQVCLLPARPLAEKEVKKRHFSCSLTLAGWDADSSLLLEPSLSLFSKLSFSICSRWKELEERTSDKPAENGLFKQP